MSTPTTATIDNLRRRKSGATGDNLGGAMNASEVSNNTVNNFWRKITETEAQAGVTIYRGFYIYNNHATDRLLNVVLYFGTPVTNSAIEVSFGHGTSGINSTSIEQTIPNEFTAPTVRFGNKWFVNPGDRADGMPIDGEIRAGEHAFVWMRMVVPSGTQSSVFTHYRMRVDMFNPESVGNIPEDFGITFFANSACADVDHGDGFLTSDSRVAFTNMTKRNHEWIQCCGNLAPLETDPTCIINKINEVGMKPKVKMCIGFTESGTTKKNRLKTEYGMGSSDYYSYDVYNIHITVMGYQNSYPVGDSQYNWVKNDLETARNRPGIEWLIVVVNDIFYPPPKDGQPIQVDPNDSEKFDASLRDNYHPLFMANFVHVVITGGGNLYWITNPITHNNSDPTTPTRQQVDQEHTYTWYDKGFQNGASIFINVGTVGLYEHGVQSPITGTDWMGSVGMLQPRKSYTVMQWSNFGKKLHLLRYKHTIDELTTVIQDTIEKVQPPGSGGGSPPPPPPEGQLGPYVSTGNELGATTRRAVRHYASGAPDDETVEKNTLNIPYQHYQCVYFVTLHDVEHDDNISVKLGGTHFESGWFDHGISFFAGRTCMGYEPDHPNTESCVIVGPSFGNIQEKRIGIAAVYRKPTNFNELWIKMPNQPWFKALASGDIDGFDPNNSENDEAQLRIDGFTDGDDPTIDVAVVQEIAPA